MGWLAYEHPHHNIKYHQPEGSKSLYITTIIVVVVLSHHSDASQTCQQWELLSFSTLLYMSRSYCY